MKKQKSELLQGTLDLLILKVLSANQELHGWDISKRIQLVSSERLLVKQGSLYPALHRLEQKNWIEAKWGVSEAGRSAKFYHLTSDGRKQLESETSQWQEFVDAVASILKLDDA